MLNATTIPTPTTKQVVVLNVILNGRPSSPLEDAWFKFSCTSLSMVEDALTSVDEFIVCETKPGTELDVTGAFEGPSQDPPKIPRLSKDHSAA